MTSESGTSNQLLSVRQAAQLLLVHVSTIRRWIKQGKLPAYRAGEKGVRVRLGDLSALLTPLGEHGQDGLHAHEPETISLAPLTPEEVGQARRAIEEVSRLQAEVREQNGSPLLESSAELLNALREERTRHLTSP